MRITADYQNNVPEWWDAARRADLSGCSRAARRVLRVLCTPGGTDSVRVSAATAAEVFALAASWPGWCAVDAPERAPNPLLLTDIGASEEEAAAAAKAMAAAVIPRCECSAIYEVACSSEEPATRGIYWISPDQRETVLAAGGSRHWAAILLRMCDECADRLLTDLDEQDWTWSG